MDLTTGYWNKSESNEQNPVTSEYKISPDRTGMLNIHAINMTIFTICENRKLTNFRILCSIVIFKLR